MKTNKTYTEVQVQSAIEFAFAKHRYQWRKGTGSPYILHPLQVADRLGRWGLTKTDWTATWMAAILHDVIEDTDATYEEIDYLYGSRVAGIVQELTFRNREDGEDAEAYSLSKEAYLLSFRSSSLDALVIKVADRLHNVEDFLYKKDERYAVKYFDKASSLIETVDDRTPELAAKFGRAVVSVMASDIGKLIKQIDLLRVV